MRKQPQGYSVELCREIASGIAHATRARRSLETRWVALTIQNRLEAVSSRTGGHRMQHDDLDADAPGRRRFQPDHLRRRRQHPHQGASARARAARGLRRQARRGHHRDHHREGLARIARSAIRSRPRSSPSERVPTGLKLIEESKVDGFASDRTTLIGLVQGRPSGARTGCSTRISRSSPTYSPCRAATPISGSPSTGCWRACYRSGEIGRSTAAGSGALGPPSALLSATYFIQGISE